MTFTFQPYGIVTVPKVLPEGVSSSFGQSGSNPGFDDLFSAIAEAARRNREEPLTGGYRDVEREWAAIQWSGFVIHRVLSV